MVSWKRVKISILQGKNFSDTHDTSVINKIIYYYSGIILDQKYVFLLGGFLVTNLKVSWCRKNGQNWPILAKIRLFSRYHDTVDYFYDTRTFPNDSNGPEGSLVSWKWVKNSLRCRGVVENEAKIDFLAKNRPFSRYHDTADYFYDTNYKNVS